MTKGELVEAVMKSTEMSRDEVGKSVEAITSAIINAVRNRDKLTVVGFGTFVASERKKREGKNPRTGEPITIPAARVPKFSAGKAFKDRVNPKPEVKAEKPKPAESKKDKPGPKKKKG
ncbi:MAG: HU family DNA-binding protein [Nitrospirae bacterium]|nr:HU family DNA-binding protein [Nitrospirota bacterium]